MEDLAGLAGLVLFFGTLIWVVARAGGAER